MAACRFAPGRSNMLIPILVAVKPAQVTGVTVFFNNY